MALILVRQKHNTVETANKAERRPWTMAAANAPNPLGIHLGPTHLTAAEVTVRGNHLIPVARISGGIEYRQEYLRTLGPSYHPDSSTSDPIFAGPEQEHDSISLDLITSTLRSLKEVVEENLKRKVDDAMIIVPTHFNHYSIRTVMRAARTAGFAIRYPRGWVRPFRIALHKAYGLERCEVVGHPPTCDTYDGHTVLSLDYNSGSLGVSILEAVENMSNIYAPSEDPSLGEENLPINLDRAQSNKVSQSIRKTIFEGTSTVLSRKTQQPQEYKPLTSEIRAVVLSGDASIQGFDNLRKLLSEEFADLCDGPVIDDLDPAYVLAYGAARLAKQCIVGMKNEGKMFACGDATDWFRENGGEELW